MWTWTIAIVAALFVGNSESRVVLQFGSKDCQACQQMQSSMDRLVDNDGWVVRYVDAQRDKALVEKWRVHQTPTLIVLENGREVDRILKVLPYEQLKARLEGREPDPILTPIPSNIDPRYSQTRNSPTRRSFDTKSDSITRDTSPNLANSSSAVIRGQSPTASNMVPLVIASKQTHDAIQRFTSSDQQLSVAPSTPSQEPSTNFTSDPQGATVRIRVDDGRSDSVGTGTIIDSVGNEALVLTCGHLFRDSGNKSRITVELFQNGRSVSLPAMLVDFRADQIDIGLISFKTNGPVPMVRLLPRSENLREGQKVFSWGCDHGADPTRRDTQITKLDRYLGAPNVEIHGEPAVGRSGGGLFDAQGRLIGVCNAADKELNEGLYSAPAVVYQQLEKLGLKRLYDLPISSDRSGFVAASNQPAKPSRTPSREILAVVRESGKEDQVLSLNDAPPHVVEWIESRRNAR